MRAVPEWIGKTPDAAIPPRVRLRVYLKTNGHCAKCTRKLVPAHWACDHIVALVNGGQHRETNLQALCVSPCHSSKTILDVREKSKVYRAAAANAGIRKPSTLKSAPFRKAPAQRSASRPLVRRSAGDVL